MSLLISLILMISTFVYGGVCNEVKLSDHAPIPPYKVESKREIFGLCEMVLNINGQLIPVYATKNFIISGEMFANRKQVTKDQIDKVKKKVIKNKMSKLETLSYVSYRPQGASKYFYFISDPECPYCERVKNKVKDLADKYKYEIRLIWYPLPFHKGAKPKAISFICEKRKYFDYLEGKYGNKQCPKGQREVDKNIRILASFVKGTPTFIFPDGKVVVGADLTRLESAMK